MKSPIRAFCLLVLLTGSLCSKAQVPVLNSNTDAKSVMFLDFDGHTVKGTGFNYMGTLVCGGSGLSPDQIKEIFHRVAEDYAPFNLNVTTDSTKFLAAPVTSRMRVILTVTSSWYGTGYGGVAFVGSFNWGDDTPCFVFTALHQYRVKDISEATSHESGHTLGLYHQSKYDNSCNKITDYDAGQGSGEIGWAPIMGVGYYQNFTVWHNGANSFGCTSMQSDLEIITSGANGFGYRPDDHRNSFDSATVPTFASNQFRVEGVVEKNTDQDLFKFIMPGTGQFQLDAIPNNVGTGNLGSDLDMQVSLYSDSHDLLSVYNPGMLLSSLVDTFLTPGTYFLKIEGRGNAFASNYASLGSYSLLGRIQNASAPLPLHRLQLRGVQNGERREFTWLIDADESVMEQFLEVATDGRNYVPLAAAEAKQREYTYRATDAGKIQYRLNVTFNDGRRYYSNVVTLNSKDSGPYPKLTGNLIRNNSIYISSPAKFSYTVFDFNGKTLKQGIVNSGLNEVNAPAMTAGMYMIRFEGNGQAWTEKFVRQ